MLLDRKKLVGRKTGPTLQEVGQLQPSHHTLPVLTLHIQPSRSMAGIQLDVWYLSMPPITRAFMTACVATTVFEYLGIVSIMDLYLNFSLVTERTEVRIHYFRTFAS